jgi:hypothetical protein
MSRVIDQERLEDISVANDGQSPEEVARDVLQLVGWIG